MSRTGSSVYVLEIGNTPADNAIRKIDARTEAVSTLAKGGYLEGNPTHLEVDSNGNPWVAVSTGVNQKGIVKFDQEGVGTLMVENICCAYFGSLQVGEAFEFDHAGGWIYYSTATGVDGGPDEPKFPRIYRLPVSSLPAQASSGEDLGGTGNFIRGPVTDMEFGPDGKLYIIWPKSGPNSAQYTQLWRLNGANSFELMVENWPGHEVRMAFSATSSAVYSTCLFWCNNVQRRLDYGRGTLSSVAGSTVGPAGDEDGDPGKLNWPQAIAITADGSTAYVGDANNGKIKKFRVIPDWADPTGDGTRGWHGDPVDTGSGSFRQDEIDLTSPAGAGPAGLGRTFTSISGADGVFGPRWMSPLDTRLRIGPDDVLYETPNGQRVEFVDGGTSWEPADGQASVLTETTGGWTVTELGGTERDFDEDGLLVATRTPGQPEVTITWDDMSPLAMTSASGYEVTFEDWRHQWVWDPVASQMVLQQVNEPDGTIDRAITNDGRQVDYTYDRSDANGALATASRPHAVGQAAGTYGVRTYEMDGGYLTRIVDQVDSTRTRVVVENTYDDHGRVTEQVTATGDTTTFAYDLAPDGLGNLVAAPGSTTVTDTASGDVTVYEHDSSGAVVAITDALGNDLSRTWDADRPDASSSRSGVDTDQAYDDAGRLIELTETAGTTTRTIQEFTYVTPDSSPAALTDNRVATRTDEAGVTTKFTYAGVARQPETVSVPCDPDSTDPSTPCPGSGLATTTYTYYSGSLSGLVESVTDPDGVVTEYTYAADRSVGTTTTYDGATPLVTSYEAIRVGDPGWSETNPAAVEVRTTETPGGAVTIDVFDAEGHLIESRDPLYDGTTHLATTYTYSLDGELVSVTDPGGLVTTHAIARPGDPGWAEAPEIAEVRTTTGPDGISSITKTDLSGDVVVEQRGDPAVPGELATTTNTYGALGRLESSTDPMGVTTSYDYDVEGRVTAVVDEASESTETDYDAFGRPTVVTDPLGETTTTTYGPGGRVTAVEDREGHDTSFTYDDAGRPHTTTDARGGVVEQTYTRAGRLASETDATGRTTSYAYDTAGRQVAVELPSGATTTTDYDLDGRVATVTSPEGRVTTYTYDDLGRTLTVADPATGTTTTTYTPSGDVATRTDATGGEIAYGYTGGQLTSVTDPLDRETTYTYDSRGNRTKRIDALLGEREWHFNLADQLTAEIDPLDRTTTYTYDTLGRLDITTDGAARTTDRGYDAAGQVTSLTYATGAPTTFGYDGEGRRTSMVDTTGTTTWSYNATGQMTGANLPGSRDLAFAWDLAGRRTVIDYPDGARYRNRYDTDGRLSEVEHDQSGTWVDVAVNTYDDDGLLLEQDQGTSGAREWTYDAVTGRTTSYADTRNATTTTTSLTHDAAGRIASETTGGLSTVYDYDDAGQLTLVDRSTGSDETYAYDELGRRTTALVGATTTTYQWDAASQLTRRVINGANRNYQYDTSGRRTRDAWNGGANVLQYFWGSRGSMTGQRYTEPGTVTDTSRATRGDGTLATLTTTVNGSPTDTTSIVWDPTLPVPQPVWTGDPGTANATRAIYGPDLIRFTCPTGTSCTGPAAHDHLGSALETTATAAVTQDTAYTPWGDGGPTYTPGADYGYRSELHTGATIHLRARDYDPETGLFLSPDPLDGVDGTTTINNPYHYTNNDPINAVDPTGLRPSDLQFVALCPDDFGDWDDIDEPTCELPPTFGPGDLEYPFTGPNPISAKCEDSLITDPSQSWYQVSPRNEVDCLLIVSKPASTALHLVMQEHKSRSYMVRGMCGETPLSVGNIQIRLDRSLIADTIEEKLGPLRDLGYPVSCTSLLDGANGSISDSLSRAAGLSSQCLAFRIQVKGLGLDMGSPSDHAPPGWVQLEKNLGIGSYVAIFRRDWLARGCPDAYTGATPPDLDLSDLA